MSDEDNMQAMMQALNGHQITDENGNPTAETETAPESSTDNQTTVDEPATPEKATEPEPAAPEAAPQDTEEPLAEDETGKKYVPESRFKAVYGKAKQLERELEAERRKKPQATAVMPTGQPQQPNKTDLLEIELLKATLPQFDPKLDEHKNPTNPDFDPVLDQMALDIYRSNGVVDSQGIFHPGITRIEAARKAIDRAAKLDNKKMLEVKNEARTVKSLQSDQGMTNRVVSRSASQPDFNKMNDEEMEKYLKENNLWPK